MTRVVANLDKSGQSTGPFPFSGGALKAIGSAVGAVSFTATVSRLGVTRATLTQDSPEFRTNVPGEYEIALTSLSGVSASVLVQSTPGTVTQEVETTYPRRAFLIGDSITGRGNYGVTLTSITAVDGIATASGTSHALYPGSETFIANADQDGYNGLKTVISRNSSSEFTFAVPRDIVSPATGTNITSTAQGRINDRNWFEMANADEGHPFNQVINAGGSGQTTAQIRARIAKDVLAYASPGDVVQIQGTFNDFVSLSTDLTQSQIELTKANLLSMIQQTLSAGCIPLVLTSLPYGTAATGYRADKNQAFLRINQYLRELAAYTYPGIVVFDAWASCVNPTATSGDWKTSYSSDGTHPTALACQRMSQDLALIFPAFRYKQTQWAGSITDCYDYDTGSRQINPNPLMRAGTGGTAATSGAGSGSITQTDSIPENYTLTWTRGGAGGSCTVTTPARSDGFGEDFTIVVVADTASDAINIVQTNQLHARVSPGDRLVAEAHIQCTSITAMSDFTMAWEWASGGVTYTQPAAIGSASSGQLTDNFDWILRTPVLVIPEAGATGLKVRIRAVFSGAGGATLKIGRFAMVKLQ